MLLRCYCAERGIGLSRLTSTQGVEDHILIELALQRVADMTQQGTCYRALWPPHLCLARARLFKLLASGCASCSVSGLRYATLRSPSCAVCCELMNLRPATHDAEGLRVLSLQARARKDPGECSTPTQKSSKVPTQYTERAA